MIFEDKLKKIIKSKYSRLADLAEKFEMNYTQLSQYVNGKKVSIEFLTKIIHEFPDVDLNWLLRDDTANEDGVREVLEPYETALSNEQIIKKIEELLDSLKGKLTEK
tara:strand:- start:15341 stop:15661 length:321 start_codon:yes stop_codon:yes gene_type:complete